MLELARGETEAANPLARRRGKMTNADGGRRHRRTLLLRIQQCRDSAATAFRHGWFGFTTSPHACGAAGTGEDLRIHVRRRAKSCAACCKREVRASGPSCTRTDASMNDINGVLKKSRRAEARKRFATSSRRRWKESTAIRRDAAALKLSGLQSAAPRIRNAWQDLPQPPIPWSGGELSRRWPSSLDSFLRTIRLRDHHLAGRTSRESEAVTPEGAHHQENGTASHRSAGSSSLKMARNAAPPAQRMAGRRQPREYSSYHA